MNAEALRASVAAAIVRDSRLVVVLRRVEPTQHLLVLVDELADAGARAFEITMDAPDASADIRAARTRLDDKVDGPFAVGVGSAFVRGDATVQAATMAAVRRGQEGSVGGS